MAKNYRPAGVAFLPSMPETYLANLFLDGNEVEILRSNIIGWQIAADRSLTPLTLDPNVLGGGEFHVIHPDGRVECNNGQWWSDVDDWVSNTRRTQREQTARK